ncbi:PhzF family phenazine biosynthesis isomerase [Bacillus pacificus]
MYFIMTHLRIKPNMGNPAGIVLEADGLTEEEMQIIAEKVGYNETAFVLSSSRRYKNALLTPGFEMDLCGHGTVGTLYALREKGLLEEKVTLRLKRRLGFTDTNRCK